MQSKSFEMDKKTQNPAALDPMEQLKQSADYFPVGLSPSTSSTNNNQDNTPKASFSENSLRKFNRCQCDNCVNERLGLLRLAPGEKRLHVCPFRGCRKLYGKTSHLKVFICGFLKIFSTVLFQNDSVRNAAKMINFHLFSK